MTLTDVVSDLRAAAPQESPDHVEHELANVKARGGIASAGIFTFFCAGFEAAAPRLVGLNAW